MRTARSQWRLMCSSIFGVNDVYERPPRRPVAAISEVVTDVNDVTVVYAVVCGSSAGERLCPDVARVPAQVPADDDGATSGLSRRGSSRASPRVARTAPDTRCSFPHCAVDVPRSGLRALSFITDGIFCR